MYALVVSARVKPEQRGRFLEAIEGNAVTSVRDEPGCLRFDVVRDNDDPDHYLFYEVYRDADAFATHRDSDTSPAGARPPRSACPSRWPPPTPPWWSPAATAGDRARGGQPPGAAVVAVAPTVAPCWAVGRTAPM
jgi:quinol monooxygenase YgiN